MKNCIARLVIAGLLQAVLPAAAAAQVMIRPLAADAPEARLVAGVAESLLAGDSARAASYLTRHAAPGTDPDALLKEMGEVLREIRAQGSASIHSFAGSPSGDVIVFLSGGGPSIRFLTAGEPARIQRMRTMMLPVPGGGAAIPLSAAARGEALDSLYVLLERLYVSADTARLIAAHLRTRAAAGVYEGLKDDVAFSSAVTADLRAVNGDPHLGVRPSAGSTGAGGGPGGPFRIAAGSAPPPPAAQPAPPAPAPVGSRSDPAAYGFASAERLAGNIGHLRIGALLEDGTQAPFEAAVEALRNIDGTDVVILDLRQAVGGARPAALAGTSTAPGGDVGLHEFLLSHFLPPNVHTLNSYVRAVDQTVPHYTLGAVPGPRRVDVPVYILTSSATFSAGEYIAFVMQALGRAIVVGEPTGGGGRMVRAVPLGHGMAASISVSRTWDPRTGGGWEVGGVRPDIVAPAADALETALRHAGNR